QYEPAELVGQPYLAADGSGVRREPPSWAKRLSESSCGYVFLDFTYLVSAVHDVCTNCSWPPKGGVNLLQMAVFVTFRR
ncbi:MAG: hypothetical protein K1X67_02220, partial [Fimbriimonadaceae bacterium]|nr:hypothetical protein [Fimbriimonadaceae bacterium]